MLTRRDLLAGLSLPFLPLDLASFSSPRIAIAAEPHLLSSESAAAFSSLLPQIPPANRPLLLLPGSKQLSLVSARKLCRLVEKGSSLLIESGLAFSAPHEIEQQRDILDKAFNVRLGYPAGPALDCHCRYIVFAGYLVRPFGLTFPVSSDEGRAIAHFGETPVAIEKRIGEGRIAFSGTMLGPHLLASDADARQAATNLLTRLTF